MANDKFLNLGHFRLAGVLDHWSLNIHWSLRPWSLVIFPRLSGWPALPPPPERPFFASPDAGRSTTLAPSISRLKLSAAMVAPGANPSTAEILPSVVKTVTACTVTVWLVFNK